MPSGSISEETYGSEGAKMPNFLIIGAAKSGTTSLYAYLKQHPDVYMSPIKEPKFFAVDEGGIVESVGKRGRYVSKSYVNTLADYQALFKDARTEKARGEASPPYLYEPEAVRRIKRHLPDAPLIAILRHPVDRAYSAFLHQTREGLEVYDGFAEALRAEPGRIEEGWASLYHYRTMGLYAEQLERYYDAFDRDQIHVYLYDDLQRDAAGVTQDIFRVLGIDDTFLPDTLTRHNISGVPKNKLLHRVHHFLKGSTRSGLKELGKRVLPRSMRGNVKRQLVRTLREKNLEKPPLLPEVRESLLESYREDITKLQTLIGRDLSHWL